MLANQMKWVFVMLHYMNALAMIALHYSVVWHCEWYVISAYRPQQQQQQQHQPYMPPQQHMPPQQTRPTRQSNTVSIMFLWTLYLALVQPFEGNFHSKVSKL